MRPNVEFRVELPKTNLGLAKPHFQQETHGYAQKPPATLGSKNTITSYNKKKWYKLFNWDNNLSWLEQVKCLKNIIITNITILF